ncbi:hypothetical protein AAG906_006887 [Vitis piasezkii]
MGWRGSFYFLFFLLTLVESSSRQGKMWLLDLDAKPPSVYSWAISNASIFVLVALVLSMYLFVEHLAAYNQPEEQKFLIGLILMVPVYALESFLSLLGSNAAFNCQIIRDCYEAFALYCFERYLIACLGGEKSTVEFMESQQLIDCNTPLFGRSLYLWDCRTSFSIKFLSKEWYLGPDFYQAVKMICALLAIFLEFWGLWRREI